MQYIAREYLKKDRLKHQLVRDTFKLHKTNQTGYQFSSYPNQAWNKEWTCDSYARRSKWEFSKGYNTAT